MRYTDGPDGSWEGRRPEGIPAENVETELIEVLEPSVSHNVTGQNLSFSPFIQIGYSDQYCGYVGTVTFLGPPFNMRL